MGWESIGDVNTGDSSSDLEWIDLCQRFALDYIKFVCGELPPGSELGIMSHDHELGSYSTIGVYSDYSPEFDYIHKCERALEVLNSSIEWSSLKEHAESGLLEDENEEDEADEEEIEEDAD